MGKDKLESVFYKKIYKELSKYKEAVISQEKEDVFGCAYEIDCMINLYETLVESGDSLQEKTLETLISVPNLLALLYVRWMGYPDQRADEWKKFLLREIEEIMHSYQCGKVEKTV